MERCGLRRVRRSTPPRTYPRRGRSAVGSRPARRPPYSTVLQAEQALFPAEIGLAAVRSLLYVSGINIYKAMGGGWVTEADRMTPSATGTPAASERPPLF